MARRGCRRWTCWEYWSTGRCRDPKTARPGAHIGALTPSPCCSAESADTSASNRKERTIKQKDEMRGAPALSPAGLTSYLGLSVGLQSEQTADLLALGLNHSGAHIVLRVWIDVLQKGCSQSQQLDVEKNMAKS